MNMPRIHIFFIFCLCCVFTPAFASDDITPRAVQGVLDLRHRDLPKKGALRCEGVWEFYWEQLLLNEDFNRARPPVLTGYITVPGIWNGYTIKSAKMISKGSLSGNGYATYRLRILLHEPLRPLAFKFNEIGTAYTCYVDGKRLCSAGIVGKSRETTRPAYVPQVVVYAPEKNSIDLVLHISNFHHAAGGPWGAIVIGDEAGIRRMRESRLTMDMFLFGCIFIMGLYHLGLFLYRRKDRSTLFFALICFLFSARILTIGEYYLVAMFPGIIWDLIIKTQYLTLYGGVLLFLMFFQVLFPGEFSNPVLIMLTGIGLAFCALVIVTPAWIYTFTIQLYEIYTIVASVYLCVVLAQAVHNKRSGSVPLLVGFAVLFAVTVNDVLHHNLLIRTGYYSHLGLFFFIVSQSFTIVAHYSETLKQYTEARYKLLQDRMSPHFLFNALNAIHAHLFREPRQAEDALLKLAQNYRYILEYTDRSMIPFDEEWQFVKNYLDLEELRFRDRLDVQIEKKGDFSAVRVPPLTLQPLVENALKHGLRPKKGMGHLSVTAEKAGENVVVEILDDGVGLLGKDLYSRSLGNIRERLAHYCDHSSLVIQQRAEGGVAVRVSFSAAGGEE